ncbi:ABC transporter permease subunit [Litorilinea aerophila]|uniref:ABC transporter permease subunit n=1 Tax=Litorilinea aerophila TaxID=1204385 RepID=A0A540VJC1_9CHLR|nr:ABC transporter permease subunit [Litorilinea aerophila]MCC9075726.1 ABC transporter permease subunit [Litorilinea aerophila]
MTRGSTVTELSLSRPSARPIRRPSPWNGRNGVLAVALLLVGWSLVRAGLLEGELVNAGGWVLALRFGRAALQPDLTPDLLSLTLHSTLITLAYAVCGTALSLAIGVVGGILSSEVWWQTVRASQGEGGLVAGGAPWLVVRSLLSVPRAIHEAIWGLIFINIFGLDPVSGILALGIPFGAITAKVFSEILDETPRGALQALRAGGAPPLAAFFYSLIPQAFADLLSYTFYRFECAIRSATILGLIGAGGLGYQILLSLQSLRYEQMWTFLYALILLCGLTDLWSARLRWRLSLSRPLAVCKVTDGEATAGPNDRLFRSSLWLALGLTLFSFWFIGARWELLWAPRSGQLFREMVATMFPPRLELAFWRELTVSAVDTLAMSILASAVAGVGGMLLAFPAAGAAWLGGGAEDAVGWMVRPVAWFTRGLLLLTRSIAEPIWALLAMFVLFPGLLPGAVGLGLYNLGILGRLNAEVVENLDERPTRAIQAQGASRLQAFLYAVWPRALPRFVGYALYRWEVCIRATVVVGLVGAGGLGRLLQEQLVRFDYHSVSATLLVFFLLTGLVDLGSAWARRLLR